MQPGRPKARDAELMEVPADRLFGKTLPIEGENIKVAPYVQPVILLDNTTAGAPGTGPALRQLVNSSGQVVEASAANIDSRLTSLRYHAKTREGFVGILGDDPSPLYQIRKKVVAIATDGAGDAVATELVGTQAGFYPVIDSLLVVTPETEATTTITISTAGGGALVGCPAHILNLVADTVNRQLEDCLWYNLTDATTLLVAITSGPTTNTVYFQVTYHWET